MLRRSLYMLASMAVLSGCAHGGAAVPTVYLDARVLARAEVASIRLGTLALPGVPGAEAALRQTLPALTRTASVAWQLHLEQSAERRLRLRPGKPRVGQFQNNLSALDTDSGRNERGPVFNRSGRSGGAGARSGVLLRAQLSRTSQPSVHAWQGELWVPQAAFERCASFWVQTLAQTLGETVRRQEPARCPHQ